MIVVLLGTQNNSFHRLLDKIQQCIDDGSIDEEIIVQSGGTKYQSKDMKIFNLIPKDELEKIIDEADLVITHGGVGSIIMCLKKEKKIIAVPRLSKYGEHVNDHQMQIVENFDKQGYIKGIVDLEDLPNTIKEVKEKFKPNKFVSNTDNIIRIIEEFIEKEEKTKSKKTKMKKQKLKK